MKTTIENNTIIAACIFTWVGFIGAISFMEAWLKFQAHGVTKEIGLSIGSLVFNALNKVEIFLGLLILIVILKVKNHFRNSYLKVMLIPYSMLLIQSIYLLPILDERIHAIINNAIIEDSYHHIYYVLIEIIKIVSLIIIGIQILNKNEN